MNITFNSKNQVLELLEKCNSFLAGGVLCFCWNIKCKDMTCTLGRDCRQRFVYLFWIYQIYLVLPLVAMIACILLNLLPVFLLTETQIFKGKHFALQKFSDALQVLVVPFHTCWNMYHWDCFHIISPPIAKIFYELDVKAWFQVFMAMRLWCDRYTSLQHLVLLKLCEVTYMHSN